MTFTARLGESCWLLLAVCSVQSRQAGCRRLEGIKQRWFWGDLNEIKLFFFPPSKAQQGITKIRVGFTKNEVLQWLKKWMAAKSLTAFDCATAPSRDSAAFINCVAKYKYFILISLCTIRTELFNDNLLVLMHRYNVFSFPFFFFQLVLPNRKKW